MHKRKRLNALSKPSSQQSANFLFGLFVVRVRRKCFFLAFIKLSGQKSVFVLPRRVRMLFVSFYRDFKRRFPQFPSSIFTSAAMIRSQHSRLSFQHSTHYTVFSMR